LTAQLEAKRKFYSAQASALDAELKAAEAELLKALSQSKLKEERAKLDRIDMAASRKKKNSKNFPIKQNAARNESEQGI
jgi:hypothetical protein